MQKRDVLLLFSPICMTWKHKIVKKKCSILIIETQVTKWNIKIFPSMFLLIALCNCFSNVRCDIISVINNTFGTSYLHYDESLCI